MSEDGSAMNEDHDNSDGEFVSENETVIGTSETMNCKGKRKQQQNMKKKVAKPPRIPNPIGSSFENKRSPYWAHYQGCGIANFAECKYCFAKISCGSSSGTAPIKNHINNCKKYPPNLDKKQKIIDLESITRVSDDGSNEVVSVPKLWEFSQEAIRKALARMLIIDELPFNFVEHDGFREFCKVINPHFFVPSRATATRDCYNLFIEGRTNLGNVFQNLSSRVCLTTDTWTSLQNMSYMCLTAHFIDSDWHLHKRIINFCPIVGHSGALIGRAVEECLNKWGLKNIMTLIVDNACSNDLAIQHLRKIFNHWEYGLLDGKFLHMRCAAHILNLVVRDGLNDLSVSIKKVRALVKYVRSSPARLAKFKSCVEDEKIESKALVCMDVDTRWNSTFLMLVSAIKFKKAFSRLLLKDSNFERELSKCDGGIINEEDWVSVSSLLPFLKIFYDATLRFSGTRYVTSNAYMHEVFGIGKVISQLTMHVDPFVKDMANKMKLKYMKYWGKVEKLNQFLFVALYLDPRRKMNYIKWVIGKNFDETDAKKFLKSLKENLVILFNHYQSSVPQKVKEEEVSSKTSTSNTNTVWGEMEMEMDYDKIMIQEYETDMGNSGNTEKKTEMEKYEAEDPEPSDDFDILAWWKVQKCRYPVLAKMARDVLAIPVSTVASESAFSTGGRVLDSFRTSLTPRMVEAIVCSQDWIRPSRTPIRLDETFLEIEKMEEECLKELTTEQPTIIIDETEPPESEAILTGEAVFEYVLSTD